MTAPSKDQKTGGAPEDKPGQNAASPSLTGALLARFQGGSAVASWVLGGGLLLVLILVFFIKPEVTDLQRGLLRFFMALAAGFLTLFFVGGIWLSGGLRGLGIGAAGGAVLFILIQFYFDPFPRIPDGDSALKEWRGGQRLGSLIETLTNQYAAGKVTERVVIETGYEDRVKNLAPRLDRVVGKDWVEVFERLSVVTPCLVCKVGPDRKSVALRTEGELVKECVDQSCTSYTYSCKQ